MPKRTAEEIKTIEKKQKISKSIVAFDCCYENYNLFSEDNLIRSITMLVLTDGILTPYQFTTHNTNLKEIDILIKVFNVLKKLVSFNLIGYGISIYDLDLLKRKCEYYKLLNKKIFLDNFVDLYKVIPPIIKLHRYRLKDVTKSILNKEIDTNFDVDPESKSVEYCEIYLELFEKFQQLLI